MTGKSMTARLLTTLCVMLTVLLSFHSSVNGQGPNVALKGSLTISATDGVDVFSGELEQILPLINIAGRGEISEGLYLPLRNSQWIVKDQFSTSGYGGDRTYYYYTVEPSTPSYLNYARGGYTTLGVLAAETKFSGWYFMQTPSVTQLTFTSSNGTITQFRDVLTNGEAYDARARGCVLSGFQTPNPPPACSRGRVFRSIDGSNMTFVADADIYDMIFYDAFGSPSPYGGQNNIGGTLYLSNGTRIQIGNSFNNITKITDRNGNTMNVEYVTEQGYTYYFLKKITDSLNREITMVYGDNTQTSYFDEIVYKGYGNSEKRIRINYTHVQNVMAPGEAFGMPIFPGVTPRCYMTSSGAPCDPTPAGPSGGFSAPARTVPSSIVLPNGSEYQFYYNRYLELARIKYPTGSFSDYVYSGMIGAGADGYSPPVYGGGGSIYRRVSAVRNFDETAQLISEKAFSNIPQFVEQSHPSFPALDNLTIDIKDGGGNVLAETKHYFYDVPSMGAMYGFLPASFGKEYKTEILDPVSHNVLRRTETSWQQREAFPWCGGGYFGMYICFPGEVNFPTNAPAVDPRVTEVKITLETGQVTKKTFSYDQYNNVTDTYEYDYGSGQVGPLLRRSHSDYVTDPNYIASYLLRLPLHTWISSDANGSYKSAYTDYEYDNYNGDQYHAALIPRGNVSGFDTNYHAGFTRRGNPTAITGYANAQDQTGPNTEYSQYDVLGNVVKGIDARGVPSIIDYSDRFGSPNGEARGNWDTVSMPSQLGGASTFAFATSTTNSLGHTSYSQFDYSSSLAVDVETVNGNVTSTTYNDPLNRPTLIARPDGGTTVYSYNDVPGDRYVQKEVKQDATRTQTSRQYLNGLDQTIRSYSLDGVGALPWIAVVTEYDNLGRVYRVSNPYRTASSSLSEAINPPGQWTVTTYDAFNRIATLTSPDGSQTTTTFTGNAALVNDPAGKKRKNIMDAFGRPTQLIEDPGGLNFQTNYFYDPLGNVRRVEQGAQRRYFMYDALSRLTRVRHPELDANQTYNLFDPVSENSQWSIIYTYDGNDNVTGKSDARGVVCTYVYDDLNRLVTRSYTDGTPTVTNSYDAAGVANSKGRRTSVSSSVSAFNITGYDAIGHVTGSSQVVDGQTYTLGYTYDLAGNLLTQTYPSGRIVSTSYDTAGRISSLSGQNAGVAKTYASEFGYATHGALASFHLGNGLWEHTNYNSRLQPTEIGLGATVAGVEKLQLGYGYGTTNNNGSVVSATIALPGLALNQSFVYDQLNRLQLAQEQNASNSVLTWKQTYSHDRFGNNQMINYDGSGNALPGPALSEANNRIAFGQGYGYDAMGNVSTSPGPNTYNYDAEGRQVAINNGQTAYSYDGDGRRVKKASVAGETTVYVYNIANQIIAEYANVTMATQATTKYLTTDGLGTLRVVTDGSGQVLARRDHLPFGEDAGSRGGRTSQIGYAPDNTRQRFTGYERDDESGLEYAQARYYASGLGRFNSVDPVVGSLFDPQTLNKYSYVGNDPLNRTDPDGQYPRSQHKFVTYLLAVLAGRSDAAEIARGADAADNFMHAATGLFGFGWIINFHKHFGVPPTAAELQGLSGFKLGFKLHLVQDNSIGAPHYLAGSYSLGARIKSSFIHIIRNLRGNSPDTDPNLQAGWKKTWEALSNKPYPQQMIEFITITVNDRGLTIVGMQIIQPNGTGGTTIKQLGSVDLSKAKLISTSIKNNFIVNIWQYPKTNPYDDPAVQQIQRNFSLPGSNPIAEAEALYIYWLPWPVH